MTRITIHKLALCDGALTIYPISVVSSGACPSNGLLDVDQLQFVMASLRDARADGLSIRKIAAKYKMSTRTIQDILKDAA